MNKFKFSLLALVVVIGSMTLQSCKDEGSNGEGGDGSTPNGPKINFLAGGNYISSDAEIIADEDYTIGISASASDSRLEAFKATVSYDGAPESIPTDCSVCDSTFKSDNFSLDFMRTTRSQPGTEKWTFTVTDRDGNTNSISLTITVVDEGTALITYEEDANSDPIRVYNFAGPEEGAFDLRATAPVISASDEFIKDIQDSITDAEIVSEVWPGRWTSRNGTTFKMISGSDFNSFSTQESLMTAWDAAGAAQSTIEPLKDELYIAKILANGVRGIPDMYVLIEITAKTVTSENNSDYMQFRIKKITI